ncbi:MULTISPECIES: hypothetical protein [unclassified Pseudomonas]|uniref:hypothetical protein n=1 Tax=unclassified Pseudomonas TaxID=196821 RepID=UPI000C88332D|nr:MULTISPECIES: hypothetical protein [unclassified Pseudomonas]PMZ85843.1 hypothetical protein C1X61_25670 [Pseudomonas sp. FW215-T2]PNA08327.1 hypothetical protein C1X62_25590 [Pseudomonas sp. FW215-R3]PNB34523.1 hypothetical protein C1X63_26930 [Pseudomonas sp. FW305-131]
MKCYVFPVRNGVAYWGVKSLLNPYNGAAAWCAGFPSVFGGNDDDDNTYVTCAKETTEESHRKIELDPAVFQLLWTTKVGFTHYIYYYARGFNFSPNAVLSLAQAAMPSYQEGTGDVLLLDMNNAPVPDLNNLAPLINWILQEFRLQFPHPGAGDPINNAVARQQFNTSEHIKAFARLVTQHQANPII